MKFHKFDSFFGFHQILMKCLKFYGFFFPRFLLNFFFFTKFPTVDSIFRIFLQFFRKKLSLPAIQLPSFTTTVATNWAIESLCPSSGAFSNHKKFRRHRTAVDRVAVFQGPATWRRGANSKSIYGDWLIDWFAQSVADDIQFGILFYSRYLRLGQLTMGL